MDNIPEAIIWCPKCGEDRFRVLRQPAPGRVDVFHHKLEPVKGAKDHKKCDNCHGILERRSDG